MPKYIVRATEEIWYETAIEAPTMNDAWDTAYQLELSEMMQAGDDSHIDEVEEVPEETAA